MLQTSAICKEKVLKPVWRAGNDRSPSPTCIYKIWSCYCVNVSLKYNFTFNLLCMFVSLLVSIWYLTHDFPHHICCRPCPCKGCLMPLHISAVNADVCKIVSVKVCIPYVYWMDTRFYENQIVLLLSSMVSTFNLSKIRKTWNLHQDHCWEAKRISYPSWINATDA